MKKALVFSGIIAICVVMLCVLVYNRNNAVPLVEVQQVLNTDHSTGANDDFTEPTSKHHNELPVQKSAVPGAPEEGAGIQEEQKDKYYDLDLDLDHGSDISMEEITVVADEMLRRQGITPPHRPYWARLKEIHKMVEARGYKRETLYSYYRSITNKSLYAAYGEGEETAYKNYWEGRLNPGYEAAAKAEQQRWENSKTKQLYDLFKREDRESIEEWIASRLSVNEHDIPALYAKKSLYYSPLTIDILLDTIEEIVIALDSFEPRGVPKEAILYDILSSGAVHATRTERSIAGDKQENKGGISGLGGRELLLEMELAGDW